MWHEFVTEAQQNEFAKKFRLDILKISGTRPSYKVGIEGESWHWAMAGSVRGPFTDASASCEKTEQQLTRLARLIGDTFPLVVFKIIAYIIFASSVKRLPPGDTDYRWCHCCCWRHVTSVWPNRCDWMFIRNAKAQKSTWKGNFFCIVCQNTVWKTRLIGKILIFCHLGAVLLPTH